MHYNLYFFELSKKSEFLHGTTDILEIPYSGVFQDVESEFEVKFGVNPSPENHSAITPLSLIHISEPTRPY